MTDDTGLIPGRFYWTIPANDPDTDEEWEHDQQPARFARYREDGTPLWHCLNVQGESEWPMRWVGPEIVICAPSHRAI